jgi:hypothetical protein
MELEPFVILVADRDATVGVIASMLLSSALATELTSIKARVRVLIEPEIISVVKEPELPEEVRKIEEQALSATRADAEGAKLVVAFSGIDVQKLDELRKRGIAAPAVNLCQFVDNLEELTRNSSSTQIDARDVLVSAALQFGFSGGSSTCTICEAQERENIDYWVNIADTCSRFAHTVQKLQS